MLAFVLLSLLIACVRAEPTVLSLVENEVTLSVEEVDELLQFAVKMHAPGWLALRFAGVKEKGDAEDGIVVLLGDEDGAAAVHSFVGTLEAPGTADAGVLVEQSAAATSDADGRVLVSFSRPVHGCRQNGAAGGLEGDIPSGNIHVEWAYGTTAASLSPEDDAVLLTAAAASGVKSVFLRGAGPLTTAPDYPDLTTIPLRMNNVPHPVESTTMLSCRMFAMPDDRERTIVGFKPEHGKADKALIHHTSVYDCTDFIEWGKVSDDEPSHPDCYTAPEEIVSCMNTGPMLFTANKDGSDEYLPEQMGFSLGGEHAKRVYMLQVHTNKARNAPAFTHSFGVEIVVTEQKRPYEAGLILMGLDIGQIVIPGLVTDFPVLGKCSSQCTRDKFPEDGVTITAVMFHMHGYGVSSAIDVVRYGTGQVERIASNANFDYHHQDFESLKNPVHLRPGDELVMSSNYTNETPRMVLGSMKTEDEMNLVFLRTYPRMDIAYCYSGLVSKPEDAFENWVHLATEISGLDGHRPVRQPSDVDFRIEGVRDIFDKYFLSEANTDRNDDVFMTQCFGPRKPIAELEPGLEQKVPFTLPGTCDTVQRLGLHNRAWPSTTTSPLASPDPWSMVIGKDTAGTVVAVAGLLAVVVVIAAVAVLFKKRQGTEAPFAPLPTD